MVRELGGESQDHESFHLQKPVKGSLTPEKKFDAVTDADRNDLLGDKSIGKTIEWFSSGHQTDALSSTFTEVPIKVDLSGYTKVVKKMTDGTRFVAGKFIRDYEDDFTNHSRKLDKSFEATKEFQAYHTLQETPLGKYVPEPICLLNDEHGEVIGLGVDWVEGDLLDDVDPSQYLIPDELMDLHKRILATRDLGTYINSDMIDPINLIITNDQTNRIRFAECLLDVSNKQEEECKRTIPTALNYLRDNRMRRG